MNILSPKTLIFGQTGLPKAQATQPLPGHNPFGLATDLFSRQPAMPGNVQFAGSHKDGNPHHNEQLYRQFNHHFQTVIQTAIGKATANRDSQLTAEHLVWAAIKTLDDLAGWEVAPGRHSRASSRSQKEQAEQLTRALLPNHPNLPPEKAVQLLRPLADELARGFDQHMDIDDATSDEEINLGLQRALQTTMRHALKSEEEGVEAAPQALFRKILWQVPPIPSFTAVANTARNVIQPPEPSRPVSPSDSASSAAGDGPAIDNLNSPAHWENFAATLQEKSPGLAKWVNQSNRLLNSPTYNGVKLAPLSQIVASGLEQAQRELNPTGRRRPNELDKAIPFKSSLTSLIPAIKDNPKLDRGFVGSVLERHRKTLQTLPLPKNPAQAEEQAQHSREVIEQFIQEPGRDDYSLAAFVDYLKGSGASTESSGASKARSLVSQVLQTMQNDAQDTRKPLMEQFEKTVPALLKNGANMVRLGLDKQLPEVLLRRQATDSMLAILNSGGARTNILLNANSGEGKTYAVQGLAQRIADNDVPPALKGAQMVQLNLGALESNTSFRGDLETKIEDIFKQLNKYLSDNPDRKVILFVDEAHMLGDMMDTMKASGILEKKNLSFIGATTPADWRKSATSSDQAFQGRFQELSLPNFNRNEKLAILGYNSVKLGQEVGASISPDVVELALDQAAAKWPENVLRHATNLLELSISLAKNPTLEQAALKDQLQHKELWQETLKAQKDLNGRFRHQLTQTSHDIQGLNRQIQEMDIDMKTGDTVKVQDKHVRQALKLLTGERIGTLSQSDMDKVRNAKNILGQEIVGQPEALSTLQKGLRKIVVRQKAGSAEKKPVLRLLLCGPTGVGKTEVLKVIAREFTNGDKHQFNMGEYTEQHKISSLLGSPPGYVGHENGGLFDKVRKSPNSLLNFDEMEKAHKDLQKPLIQILDEGEVRDNQGSPISFSNNIVAVTTNLHNQKISKLVSQSRLDVKKGKDPSLAERELETQVKKILTEDDASRGDNGFRAELLNRFDYIIPFNPLTRQNVSDILDIRLQELNQLPALKNSGLSVALSDKARQRLVEVTAASSEPVAQEKPKSRPQPGAANATRNNGRKKTEKPEEATMLQGGAREVGRTFERLVKDMVLDELSIEPELSDITDTRLLVDYNPNTSDFQLKPQPKKPTHRPPSPMDLTSHGRTLAFA